jgi:hypothetical protein
MYLQLLLKSLETINYNSLSNRAKMEPSKSNQASQNPSQTPTPILKSSVGVNNNIERKGTRSSSRIAYSQTRASQSRLLATSQNRVRKTYRDAQQQTSTDKMQAGMRPRQRTFTSCTECRRRKQRVSPAFATVYPTVPPSYPGDFKRRRA